ncbi:MAG TPA: glycosyltransferase family 2 protein, partial [Alphaproteobacteria bacterium]|nr:glycosyltransferase family 2 protein [Alphaproteobacteria bacterium]
SYFKSAAFGSPPVWTSAVGIPKNILIEVGGFNIDEWRGEDLDLWARIAIKYPIAFSWEGIAIYHTEATNRACNRIEPLFKDLVIVNNIRKVLESDEIHHEIRNGMYEYVAKLHIYAAWINYRANRSDLARQNLKKCVTNKLLIKKYWALFWTHIPVNIFYMVSYLKNKLIMKFPVKNSR